MISDDILSNFLRQFENLKEVVSESSTRSIADPPDELFYKHQNVFIKSYLVSACSMLEAFIQDLVSAYVVKMQNRINSANLPFNFIAWVAENDKARLEFKVFEANKGKKDISSLISPNYWKTLQSFERIGVNLSSSNVHDYKDFVVATVEKRNMIVHHNDEALDVSFSDVINTIDLFKSYCECLFKTVCLDPHLAE